MFERQEVCDNLDNDCDGNLNEAPSIAGMMPPSEFLFRSCYTGPPGTSKNGICMPGISVCRETVVPTDAGVESIYEYGDCEHQVVPMGELCDSLDNDCDGTSDEGVLNICGLCGEDPVEVCDGLLDEDCDGLIDEGLLNICGNCGPDPLEICDGLDNDCDNQVDEQLLNACGDCGDVPRELCDFLDNDCDGAIDEDFDDGACVCDHPDYVPQPESCNNQDDDCDGLVDEGPLGGPLTKLCSTDILTGEIRTHDRREDGPQYIAGDCRLGISFCEMRRNEEGVNERGFYECLQEVLPGVERCDEIDNDCDGNADEDFDQGRVAVMMVVDVSGSMDEGELGAAFTATRDSVRNLFNNGVVDICYMLAVVGNDDMPDPYLFYPGDTCVPGVEDPPVVPIEDMSNAVNTLRLNLQGGFVNQGGSTENTLDAIGHFFTDDKIDWDRDGIPDNILWSTNRPEARINGVQDAWDVDLSGYTHRVVIVLGDEPAQGEFYNNHIAASAMAFGNGMVFIIGTRANMPSYQPLIDFGAVHTRGLDGINHQNAAEIAETVEQAIEEAACINDREAQEEDEQEEEAAIMLYYDFSSMQCRNGGSFIFDEDFFTGEYARVSYEGFYE